HATLRAKAGRPGFRASGGCALSVEGPSCPPLRGRVGLGKSMARSRIFVSHSHEDDALCRALVAALRRAGADVWCDERSHTPGQARILDTAPLRETSQTELLDRPICIVVLSSAALACARVREDCEWACDLATDESDRRVLAVVAAPYGSVELDTLPC